MSFPAFEPAGPRRKIFFDPSKTRAAIVTCGGLCPGFNDVIRSLVLELYKSYGVHKVYGFCNGYQGFIAKYRRPVLDLSPASVAGINEQGGTILGTSRGEQDPEEIVDCMETMSINMLFVIGGDGTLRGAQRITELHCGTGREDRRGGRPQDYRQRYHVHRSELRLSDRGGRGHARHPLGHVEAESSPNGIGLVKLMGRHSGFIACYASLAMSDTNFVLIPEVPFELEGAGGFLNVLRERLRTARPRRHCGR